jgi:hypothetical protein
MNSALKKACIEALYINWEKDAPMWKVINFTWVLYGKTPADEIRKYTDVASAVGVPRIVAGQNVRSFVAKHLPKMSEALFDGRREEVCVSLGMGRRNRTATVFIRAREL